MKIKFLILSILSFVALYSCSNKMNVSSKNNLPGSVITEKYWKLTKLQGKDVKMEKNQERDVYFTLKNTDNKLVGFAGCNNFGGSYKFGTGNRIRFNELFSTLKDCPDVKFKESDFINVFKQADNFIINIDTLTLNVGKRTPLATFEAVYF